jgi:hypothetical protein
MEEEAIMRSLEKKVDEEDSTSPPPLTTPCSHSNTVCKCSDT